MAPAAESYIAASDRAGPGPECSLGEEDTPGPMGTPEAENTVGAEDTLEGAADMAEGRKSPEV
jgi:hypothetical protein